LQRFDKESKQLMRNFILTILLACSLKLNAQGNIAVELPESYELSNIILALTKYGRADPWEVQKSTHYYKDILNFFDPVKHHPLLDSVNYSREKWEDFLSFRTDAYAFSFNDSNRLIRDYNFSAVKGHQPFDEQLELINDFVSKSNFRKFFQNNRSLYQRLIDNYKDYYFFDKIICFLDHKIGRLSINTQSTHSYKVVISPLVGRMNCHRDINASTAADFPALSKELIADASNWDMRTRVVETHTVFTETNHGYINPISSKYSKEIEKYFTDSIWDKGSGYRGINILNEYMTWAVYDLFLKENFPYLADSIATQWHYQNSSRGFVASSLFAQKVIELYQKNKGKKFEELYMPLLKWCKKVEKDISQPVLVGVKNGEYITIKDDQIEMNFSEKMYTAIHSFGIKLIEIRDGKKTGREEIQEVTTKANQLKWMNKGKKLSFKIDTDYSAFGIVFNWWGIEKSLTSNTGVMLEPYSVMLIKK
jgi:hypothetical protein